jgi:hypothetical protein
VPFREPLARRILDQFGVIESRRAQTQRAIDQQLPKCGEEQIRAANYFTDLHRRVIRNYRQLISRHVVFSPNNEIAEIPSGGRALRSKALIDELQRLRIRHTKTPVVPRGRIEVADRSTLRPAGSWINWLLVFMVRRAGGLKDITPRTGAGIKQRRVPQDLPGGQIGLASFTLDVRRERPANVRSLFPSQSKPMKVFDDGLPELRPASIAIQIFDSENELSIGLSSTFLCMPERDRVADMQKARRRRGDAAPIGNFRFQIADFRLA